MPTKRKIRIGHFQCSCQAGEFDANLRTILRGLAMADEERLDIVSFPETFLGGYFDSRESTRRFAWPIDGPEIAKMLDVTGRFAAMFMVGFIELRGDRLYNTVLAAERGDIIGRYSKAFPCYDFFTPGREFPVFEKKGVKFGIIICADGGYIEPARILALKGAEIIFAPHYNYIIKERLIDHYQVVRHDHVARAVENGVWFLRGNNVHAGPDAGQSRDGVGYGDSYLIDPDGEFVARAGLHAETLLVAAVDPDRWHYGRGDRNRSRKSARALGAGMMAAANGE